MEINYDTIIKYLCNENKNNFITKKNISKMITDFPLFKNFFRTGINIFNQKNINMSLLYSILYNNNKQFIYLEDNEKFNNIEHILNNIKIEWNNIIKSKTKKLEGTELIFKYMNGKLTDYKKFYIILCKCFHINILILDFKNKETKLYSDSYDIINPFLPTIILAKHNNNFEPVYSNKDKIFNIMDNMFLSILNEYKVKTIEDLNVKEKNNNIFINTNNSIPNKTKIKKMKKQELLDLCTTMKIDFNNKDTRAILINKILKKINI